MIELEMKNSLLLLFMVFFHTFETNTLPIYVEYPFYAGKAIVSALINIGKGQQALAQSETNVAIAQTNHLQAETNKHITETVKTVVENTAAVKEVGESVKETNNLLKKGFEGLKNNASLDNFCKCITVVTATVSVCYFAKQAWDWKYPDTNLLEKKLKEEAHRLQKIEFELELMPIERQMNKCLAEHINSVKREDGMPSACQDAINAFAAIAGFPAKEKVREAFIASR